jgi:DNA-binding NarL/FixJ family response regulator
MAQEARPTVPAIDRNMDLRRRAIRAVVVDDSDMVLDAICALLEMDGNVEVVGCAVNGVDALEAVAALLPDLVLMDVDMPAMDGIQCATLLAQHFPDIKVVLMSAIDSPKIREQCRNLGVDGFAYKINFKQA